MKKIYLFLILISAIFSITVCDNIYDDAHDKYFPDAVYIFSSSAAYRGDQIGGRAGADEICRAAHDSIKDDLGTFSVRALISVDSVDTVRNMPENWGVPDDVEIRMLSGTLVDYNWDAMLDNIILNAFYLPGTQSSYWTGSDVAGNALNTCSGWSFGENGTVGSEGGVTGTFLNNMPSVNCSTGNYHIMCIAW